MSAVQLSAKSNEHYGPPEYIERVRRVMGGIDLDPASSAAANLIVRATTFYALPQDGRTLPWFGRVYLNPPGGRTIFDSIPAPPDARGGKHSSAALWWYLLTLYWETGRVQQSFFMVFNLELFRYAQGYACPHPLSFPHVFPKERIDFWAPNETGIGPQGAPGHPNALVYLPPMKPGSSDESYRELTLKFREEFSSVGKVFIP